MKHALLALLAILWGVAAAGAEPSTRPTAEARLRIMLVPFQSLQDRPEDRWIGRSIEQNLLADLSHTSSLAPMVITAPELQPATPIIDAQFLGQASSSTGAALAIIGSYEVHAPNMRIYAQLLDVPQHRILGVIKAEGAVQDLFALEDQVTGQILRLLGVPTAQRPADAVAQGQADQPAPPPAGQPPYAASEMVYRGPSDYPTVYIGGYSPMPLFGYQADPLRVVTIRRTPGLFAHPSRAAAGRSGRTGASGGGEIFPSGSGGSSRIFQFTAPAAPVTGPFVRNSPNSVRMGGNFITPSGRNYVTPSAPNYITPSGPNYVTPSGRNYIALPAPNYITPSGGNFVRAPGR